MVTFVNLITESRIESRDSITGRFFQNRYFGIGPRQNRDPGIPRVLRNNVILGHSTDNLRKAANIGLWLRANHNNLMLIRV